MSLKTDYKNEILSWKSYRTYDIMDNSTNSIINSGIYLRPTYVPAQEGDSFGASDINATNTEVNRLTGIVNNLNDDTGWQQIPLGVMWKDGPEEYCIYRQVGEVVEIRFNAVAKSNIDTTEKAQELAYGLPNACAPKNYMVRAVAIGEGKPFTVYVYQDGKPGDTNYIRFRNKENPILHAGYALMGQITYII